MIVIVLFDDIPELKAPKGKFRIVGIDRFEIPGEGHFVIGDYNLLEKAIQEATKMAKNSSKDATDESITTVYYVYDENGSFGGPNN